jgi:hypothetical protein
LNFHIVLRSKRWCAVVWPFNGESSEGEVYSSKVELAKNEKCKR